MVRSCSPYIIISFMFLPLFIFAESEAPVVKNGPVPLLGYLDLNLKEETIIDSSKEDNECDVHFIRNIAIDSEENIVVLTFDNIFKFNKTGRLLKSLKILLGQGPGEFQNNPSLIFRGSLDNLYISDGYKLIVFNKDLVFKKNIYRLLTPRFGLCVDNKGFLYTIGSEYSKSQVYKVMSILDENGKLIKKIFTFRDPGAIRRGIVLYTSHRYAPRIYYCLNSDNHLIYGYNLEYKLFKYDHNGNLLSAFTVEEKPQNISSREKNEIINSPKKTKITGSIKRPDIEFPPHRPFFKGIFSDERGRIYVFRMKSVLDKDKDEIVDIFSKDGRYLYQTEFPCLPKFIRNGSFYYIEKDDRDKDRDPIYKIKKLTIKNYNSIKY